MTDNYIAIVGHPCRDTTHFPDGRTERSLGGIVFGALALATLCRHAECTAVPVVTPGQDVAPDMLDMLGHAGCNLEAVRSVPNATQHSEITITGANERWERATGVLPMIEYAHIEPWLTGRAVAVNFITGSELSLDTLRLIHENARGPVVLDYHAIAQHVEPDGRRTYRRRSDWSAWLGAADVVQMNRDEASAIAGHPLPTTDDAAGLARELLHLGPRAVVVTLDREGAVGAERTSAGISTYYVEAVHPERLVDTVGCGDVFHAALTFGWTVSGSLHPAMDLAARAAGQHAGYAGIREIDTLYNTISRSSLETAPATT